MGYCVELGRDLMTIADFAPDLVVVVAVLFGLVLMEHA